MGYDIEILHWLFSFLFFFYYYFSTKLLLLLLTNSIIYFYIFFKLNYSKKRYKRKQLLNIVEFCNHYLSGILWVVRLVPKNDCPMKSSQQLEKETEVFPWQNKERTNKKKNPTSTFEKREGKKKSFHWIFSSISSTNQQCFV